MLQVETGGSVSMKGVQRAPLLTPSSPLAAPAQTDCLCHVDLSCLASFQNVTEKQKACETDLAKAEPALLAAQEALDTLNKVREAAETRGPGQSEGRKGLWRPRGARSRQVPWDRHQRLRSPFQASPLCRLQNNLTELKSFGSPPDAVVNVTAAVMILTAPGGKIPKDKSWKAAKIMMGKVDNFLDSLKKFDKEHIPEACLKAFK